MVNDETKRCLLCARIPFEAVVEVCLKIFPLDTIKAYEYAEKVSATIREIYEAKPYYLCGRNPQVLIAAIIHYHARLKSSNRLCEAPAIKIAQIMDVTEVALRQVWLYINDFYEPGFSKRFHKLNRQS